MRGGLLLYWFAIHHAWQLRGNQFLVGLPTQSAAYRWSDQRTEPETPRTGLELSLPAVPGRFLIWSCGLVFFFFFPNFQHTICSIHRKKIWKYKWWIAEERKGKHGTWHRSEITANWIRPVAASYQVNQIQWSPLAWKISSLHGPLFDISKSIAHAAIINMSQ